MEMRWEDTQAIMESLFEVLSGHADDAEQVARVAALHQKVTAAAAAQDDVTADIPALRRKKVDLQDALLALRSGVTKVAEESASLERTTAQEVPQVRHTVALYGSVSHIKWDFGSPRVTGVVVPDKGGIMKPFDFDPATTSDFDITNQLWDVIGEATAPPASASS